MMKKSSQFAVETFSFHRVSTRKFDQSEFLGFTQLVCIVSINIAIGIS